MNKYCRREEGRRRKKGREEGRGGEREERRGKRHKMRESASLSQMISGKRKRSDLDVILWSVKVLLLLEISHIACTYGIPRNVS